MHHDTSFPLSRSRSAAGASANPGSPPGPPPSPRSPGGAGEGNSAGCCRLGTRGEGWKGDGVLDVRASSSRLGTGHRLCGSDAGGRQGALGTEHPMRLRGRLHQKPSSGAPVWLIGKDSHAQSSLCCPQPAAALGADVLGVVSRGDGAKRPLFWCFCLGPRC